MPVDALVNQPPNVTDFVMPERQEPFFDPLAHITPDEKTAMKLELQNNFINQIPIATYLRILYPNEPLPEITPTKLETVLTTLARSARGLDQEDINPNAAFGSLTSYLRLASGIKAAYPEKFPQVNLFREKVSTETDKEINEQITSPMGINLTDLRILAQIKILFPEKFTPEILDGLWKQLAIEDDWQELEYIEALSLARLLSPEHFEKDFDRKDYIPRAREELTVFPIREPYPLSVLAASVAILEADEARIDNDGRIIVIPKQVLPIVKSAPPMPEERDF